MKDNLLGRWSVILGVFVLFVSSCWGDSFIARRDAANTADSETASTIDIGSDSVENTDGDSESDTGTNGDSESDTGTNGDSESDTGTDTSEDCPNGLVGFAALDGAGLPTTTGGGRVAPVDIITLDDLFLYAADESPRVIHISGTIDTNGSSVPISSNKTVIGIGRDATIIGGLMIRNVSNVIIQNLHIQGTGEGGQPEDTISIREDAHHVWVDHCDIRDAPDGNLDITRGADFVTVSWTRFSYTDGNRGHRVSCHVGGGTSHNETDEGKLNTTWHHNWFWKNISEAMPRVLFGKGHIFNNYYTTANNVYCVGAGTLATLLLENNSYQNVNDPHMFRSNDVYITANGNKYENVIGLQEEGGTVDPFSSAPYAYSLDPADDVSDIVDRCSGPQ